MTILVVTLVPLQLAESHPVKPSKNVTEGRYRRAIYEVTRDGGPKGRRRRLPKVKGVFR